MVPLIAAFIFISSSSFALRNKVTHAITSLRPGDKGQSVIIRGTVVNRAGDPLSSVTIIQVGTQQGTATDEKGHFTIKASANSMLQFSMIGYTTITLPVEGHQSINVMMYEDPHRMKELVVVGHSSEDMPQPPASKAGAGGIFTFVEQTPQFPGGENELIKFLHDQIRYPQTARAHHLQGNVLVSFVVAKDGTIGHIQTINNEIGGGLEEEAIRVVRAMPKWRPGRQNGEAVSVLYTLPIRFVLQ